MTRVISPYAQRNLPIIYTRIKPYIGKEVMEIASGTGQHIDYFASQFPDSNFIATDLDISQLEWLNKENIVVKQLDISTGSCDMKSIDTLYVCNLTHISPFTATQGLFKLAKEILDGYLIIYGPFKKNGVCTTESNQLFNDSLIKRNSEWGYRDIKDIDQLAITHGLVKVDEQDMPANNFLLLYKTK